MFKKLQKAKKLLAVTLVVGMSMLNVIPVFATTTTTTIVATPAPIITSATYDASTGKLVVKGSNLVAASKTFINPAKIQITDGKENDATLTTKGTSSTETPTTSTAVTIQLNTADETALAKFMDNDASLTNSTTDAGIQALNGGTYQLNVYSGWDGTASATDVSPHKLVVSNVAELISATYTFGTTTGTLKIAGTNLTSTIYPKYLTITNGSTGSYTLTTKTSATVSGGNTASITLSAADTLALQSLIFNNPGTTSAAGNNYNLTANFGWNGPTGLESMGPCGITVNDYAAPSITVAASDSITIGKPITGIKVSSIGTIYVVDSAVLNSTTQSAINGVTTSAAFEVLVANKQAVKSVVTNPSKSISIPTSKTLLKSFTQASEPYDVVEITPDGSLWVAANPVTINNVTAPALSATVGKGTTYGAITVAATGVTPPDTLAFDFSSATFTAPILGVTVTAPTSITTTTTPTAITATTTPGALTLYSFTSGSTNLTGIDFATNKYVGVYELNAKDQVVKFKLLTVPAAKIEPASKINVAAITGITAPVTGATPTATIPDTTEYAATITWAPSVSAFAAATPYTATITITPKTGYTLTGVTKNYFTVSGAKTVTNTAGSGVVTAVFSATAAAS